MTEQTLSSKLPFVNYTEISAIMHENYAAKGKEDIIDLFPRWFAQS